jgi:hypothetical protein
MLDSFERTTRRQDQIEFLIAIDEGKTEIIEQVDQRQYSFRVSFFERPLTEDFTNDYYNWLADRTYGEYIAAFNDDAWMRTKDWDVKLMQHINRTPWSIFMLDIPDTARIKYQHWFPCFPMVSRRAFCTAGFLLFKGMRMYPADRLTHEIYRHINRIIRVNDVLIEHEHIIETDASKERLMKIFQEDTRDRQVDLGPDITRLLLACSTDFKAKKSKARQIIDILKGE